MLENFEEIKPWNAKFDFQKDVCGQQVCLPWYHKTVDHNYYSSISYCFSDDHSKKEDDFKLWLLGQGY